MEISVLVIIALVGLVLFGGKIKFNGLFRRRSENRELTNSERKLLDE